MTMRIYAKRLLTPGGWLSNRVVSVADGVIVDIAEGTQGDRACDVLAPGLFDLHNHGGMGLSFRTGTAQGLAPFLDAMLRDGVTDMLMTVSTGPVDGIVHGLEMAREAMRLQAAGQLHGTRIQGVHMEGPYLNPKVPGAMNPAEMLPPDVETFERHFGPYKDIIRVVTLAPEVEGALALVRHLARAGIGVQAGHTDATWDQAEAGFAAGVDSLCHTFNAARPIHHREPSIVTASLLRRDVYCEAICDLVHLHPGTIALIHRTKGPGRMVIVSDSTPPHGLPDGEYNGRVIKDGIVRTPSGALSGGGAYLGRAVRNLISIGIAPEEALWMSAQTPAERVDARALGMVRPGMAAHLAAFDEGYACTFTVVGDMIYE